MQTLPATAWGSSLGFPVALSTPKEKRSSFLANHRALWTIFCRSANLEVERKISTPHRFHWSAKIHCHIKLTWTLEPHRKNIKVWETVSLGKNSMPVGKACQVETDNYSLSKLSERTLSKQFSIVIIQAVTLLYWSKCLLHKMVIPDLQYPEKKSLQFWIFLRLPKLSDLKRIMKKGKSF